MNDETKSTPIIIKRVKKSKHDFHGGSWKVAFADFATAMMAFFLLLWLMGNTNEAEREAISGYFNDPAGVANQAGATTSVIGEGGADAAVIQINAPEVKLVNSSEKDNIELDKKQIADLAEQQELIQLELLKKDLENLVATSDIFKDFKDQVYIDITPSGLRIQIVDKDKRPMFDSASAELKSYSKVILRRLASVLREVPNKLSITGHTDATKFTEREDYGNWELSADRANAARRVLNMSGIHENKIARVEGFSSSILFNKEQPYASINRRIAIIVLKRSAVKEIENQVLGVN